MKLKLFIYLCLIFALAEINAQETNFLTLHNSEKFKLQGTLQFGANGVAETNLFWNLADVPEIDYQSDTQWLESYVKPGLGFNFYNGSSRFYGNISAVASSTLGTDAFDEKNQGAITLELANIGYNFNLTEQTNLDLSIGAQELKLGTGMLIANGGVSGFERGTLKFGPRKAWEMSGVSKLKYKNFNATAFYIDPNELPSNDSDTRIVGFDANLYKSANSFIGVTYLNVINSNAPYPKAAPNGDGPPEITFGAREDLNAVSFYAKSYPFKGALKNLFTSLDFSYQWNDRINLKAWGGRTQIGYDFKTISWQPMFMFNYQIFSGDDPNTTKSERFDPLYYEGSPSAWTTGSKASMVFINSNLKSYGLTLRVTPSPRDILTLRYANIAAQQLRSPIQFGQAARVEINNGTTTVVAGVTEENLANDVFLEYNRVINRNMFFNAGLAFSFAGDGITNIVNDVSVWSGGFVNIVFNY